MKTNQVPTKKRSPRSRLMQGVRYAAIAIVLFITLAPLTWIFVTAFVPDSEVVKLPVSIIPRALTLDNVAALFQEDGAMPFVANSLMATIGSTLLTIAIATPAAYAIAKHRFAGNTGEGASIGILAARFIPGFMIVIPIFLMFGSVGLIDSVLALIIIYAIGNLPIAVWVLLPAARQLPSELLEAAAVDGASTTRTFLRIAVPLLRPAIATAATLSMIFAWNEFFFALIFTQVRAQTVPILISSFFGDSSIQWGGPRGDCTRRRRAHDHPRVRRPASSCPRAHSGGRQIGHAPARPRKGFECPSLSTPSPRCPRPPRLSDRP